MLYLISLELCVWVQRCMSPVDDSDDACGCGWVCMAACGGGEDGRKRTFSRCIEI